MEEELITLQKTDSEIKRLINALHDALEQQEEHGKPREPVDGALLMKLVEALR